MSYSRSVTGRNTPTNGARSNSNDTARSSPTVTSKNARQTPATPSPSSSPSMQPRTSGGSMASASSRTMAALGGSMGALGGSPSRPSSGSLPSQASQLGLRDSSSNGNGGYGNTSRIEVNSTASTSRGASGATSRAPPFVKPAPKPTDERAVFKSGLQEIVERSLDSVLRHHDNEMRRSGLKASEAKIASLSREASQSGPDRNSTSSAVRQPLSTSNGVSRTETRSSSRSAPFTDVVDRAGADLMRRLSHFLTKELESRRENPSSVSEDGSPARRTRPAPGLSASSTSTSNSNSTSAPSANGPGPDENLNALQKAVKDLEFKMNKMSRQHARDLDSASHSAALLCERVEVLQANFNDSAQGRQQEEATFEQRYNETKLELSTHTQAVRALNGPLSCVACTELMTRPVALPCGHSGCFKCLQDWFSRGPESRTCPTCRAAVTYAEASKLKVNVVLEDVIRELKACGLNAN